MLAGQVADADDLGRRVDEGQDLPGDELVVDDEVGPGEQFGGAEGDEPGRTRPGPDQKHARLGGG